MVLHRSNDKCVSKSTKPNSQVREAAEDQLARQAVAAHPQTKGVRASSATGGARATVDPAY